MDQDQAAPIVRADLIALSLENVACFCYVIKDV